MQSFLYVDLTTQHNVLMCSYPIGGGKGGWGGWGGGFLDIILSSIQ